MLGVVAFTLASLTAATSSVHVCFLSFLLFEFCVGIYFPSVGTVKSELERIRATMYNICRVPLNAIVVGLLLTNLSVLQCFRPGRYIRGCSRQIKAEDLGF
ncbi:SHOC2 [Symbiodinium sp. KB8]|nr:SHOC2 [Symbiodinium sp. KB8]